MQQRIRYSKTKKHRLLDGASLDGVKFSPYGLGGSGNMGIPLLGLGGSGSIGIPLFEISSVDEVLFLWAKP